MPTTRTNLGKHAESLAAEYAETLGLKVLTRNYRRRNGEIDIIAVDGETIVFIEVRSHSSDAFGSPAESITKSKIRKLVAAAEEYIAENNCAESPCRFDCIEVLFKNGLFECIRHIPNITG